MGILTAALYGLFGIWVLYLLLAKNRPAFQWPAWHWLALGLFLGLFQLLPLPEGVMSTLAPASHSIHYPDVAEARDVLGGGWRPVSIEPFTTEAELLRFGSLVAAFFLFSQVFARRHETRLLGYTVVLIGFALSMFAVYQQAKWGTLLYGRFPVPTATPFGPFVNHNHFAGFVEMCALVSLGAAIGHLGLRSPATSILFGGSAAVMGIALVLSHSRGGFIAAASGAFLLGILTLRSKARSRSLTLAICAGAVGLILLFAAPQKVFDRIGTIASPGQDVSVQFRLNLWRDSLRLFGRSPIVGTGVGTYEAAIPPYRTDKDETRAEHAESDIVEHACETGLAGVVILAGFIVTVAGTARKKFLSKEGLGRTQGILIGTTAAVFALLVHSVFDFNTRVPSNALLLAALLGILASSHAKQGASHLGGFANRLAPAVLIVALALGAAWRSTTIGMSRHITWQTDPKLAEPEDFARVAADLAEAQRWAATNHEIAFKRGLLYNEEAYRSRDAARYRDIRIGQARSSYEAALKQAPARGRRWFEYAWTTGNVQDHDTAVSLFDYSLKLEPAWSRLRANYALYLAAEGHIDEAVFHLKEGFSMTPGISHNEAWSILAPYVDHNDQSVRHDIAEGDNSSAPANK
jgi:O-antigen ligase